MKYACLVAWREFSESAKAKGFWIGIFTFPVILFLSIQTPIWLEQKATPIRYYVLVDQSSNLAAAVESRLESDYQQKVVDGLKEYARKYAPVATNAGSGSIPKLGSVENFLAAGGKEAYLSKLRPNLKPDAPPFKDPRRAFQSVSLPPGIDSTADLSNIADALKPYLRDQQHLEYDGQQISLSTAVLIPADIEAHIIRPAAKPGNSGRNDDATPVDPDHAPVLRSASGEGGSRITHHDPPNDSQIQFWSANVSDPRLRDDIEAALNAEIRGREYLARGVDASLVRKIEQTRVPFASLSPKKEKGKESLNTADTIKQWAPSGFVYLLWMSIWVVIQMLLTNTIEEKSNRIIEVLLSSVTPGELMVGKLIGIAAVGLTMVGAWMLSLFVVLSWKSGGASSLAGQILTVLKGSNIVFLFSIYFLLGFLMCASVILSIGSVCNTLKEAQSYMGVITMLMMVPLLTMTFIPKDPNGGLARILSWIPLYSPFTMMNRAAADPPLFDLIGTLVMMSVTAVAALWMAGKVFRIGILRTGQPPKILEMMRWAVRKRE
jgi:ABC-2 type transport system permease protein